MSFFPEPPLPPNPFPLYFCSCWSLAHDSGCAPRPHSSLLPKWNVCFQLLAPKVEPNETISGRLGGGRGIKRLQV